MPDILQDLPINAPIDRVFEAVSCPAGLDQWWTKTSSGQPVEDTDYSLGFGPGYDWQARVTHIVPNREFELTMTVADQDWIDTRVAFSLAARGDGTWLRFRHTGWPSANEHFRISSHCWAMYLRVLRRWLEHGERVAYDDRLDV
ncbi:MAG TPA: SRPBCC domain-containing protein [Vicinamibacterales bacterium]|nr:SRPBCC domain-containing protein [Vicinamibacterales bacterium]